MLKKIRPEYYFFLVLVALGLLYNYHEIFFMRPCGIHQWRSCVSAAFPLNYYYGGNFLTTQTNALLADGFSSDISVVEFPLIYYVISLFYRIFGVNEFWFRAVQVTIGFAGLLYLFKAGYLITRDWFYAGLIPMIIFSSPVYVFYLNGFIPDSVALSLSFIGLYYFLKFSDSKRFRTWLVSMLFFLLAGLSKTSSLLPFFGLGGVAILDLFNRIRKHGGDSIFVFSYRYMISYLAVLVLIMGWYSYARIYSDAHLGSVSAVEIRPIWILNHDSILEVLSTMKKRIITGDYHQRVFLILSLALFMGMLPFYKKSNHFLYRFNILIFLGACTFTLLFFRDMKNHDYYQINNLFLLVPLYLSFFAYFSKTWPGLYASSLLKLFLAAGIVFLIIKCDHRMKYRYSMDDWFYYSSMKNVSMYDIEPYLDELGIDRSAKVYCTPDPSINISLYLCNRKGLTDFTKSEILPFAERVEDMRKKGMEYLILGSRDAYKDVANLDEILRRWGDKIGQTGNTEIYKLKPYE